MKLLLALAGAATALGAAIGAQAAMAPGSMGPTGHMTRPAFHAFYDGHKDTFLSTDVSDRMEASQMHVNFSAELKRVPMSSTPEMYMFMGRAAAGQLPVFGSEPSEPTYSPLWHEVHVMWKAGMTPTLLTSDTAIEKAMKAGQVTEQETHVILNCPIVHVGS